MKKYLVCFNMGFGLEVDAEDEQDAVDIIRNRMEQETFISLIVENIENDNYEFGDDVDVLDAE